MIFLLFLIPAFALQEVKDSEWEKHQESIVLFYAS